MGSINNLMKNSKYEEILEKNEKDCREVKQTRNVYDSLSEEELDQIEELNMVVNLNSKGILFWDYWMLFLILYSLTVEPYRTAFYPESTPFWLGVSLGTDLFFLVDLILNFFKPFKRGKTVVTNNKKIAVNYLLGHFSLDLLSSFPFEVIELVFGSPDRIGGFAKLGRLYRLSKLMKLVRFKRFYGNEDELLNDTKVLQDIEFRRLIKILCVFVLLMHISACFLCFIGNMFLFEEDTWISASNLIDAPPIKVYIHAIYYSLATILAVGYGDVVTVNKTEKLFNIVFNFISALFFSYVIGAFSKMFYKLDEKAVSLQHNMEMLRRLTEEYKIPSSMQRKIKETLRHAVKHSHLEKYSLVESLPRSIKNQLVFLMHKRHIGTLFFTKNRSREFTTAALPLLKRPLFKQKEGLIKVGEFFDEVYLVVKGKVFINMGHAYDNFDIGRVAPDEHFGDVLLYLGQQSPYELQVKSKESTILTLTSKDFFTLVNHFSTEMHLILEKSIEKMESLEGRRKVVMELHEMATDNKQLRNSIESLSKALLQYDAVSGQHIEIEELVNARKGKKYKGAVNFLKDNCFTELSLLFPYFECLGSKSVLAGDWFESNNSQKNANKYNVLAQKILDYSIQAEKPVYMDVKRKVENLNEPNQSWKESKINLDSLKSAIKDNSKQNGNKLKDFVSRSNTLLKKQLTKVFKAFGEEKEEMVSSICKENTASKQNNCSRAELIDSASDPHFVNKLSSEEQLKKAVGRENRTSEAKYVEQTSIANRKLDNLSDYLRLLISK